MNNGLNRVEIEHEYRTQKCWWRLWKQAAVPLICGDIASMLRNDINIYENHCLNDGHCTNSSYNTPCMMYIGCSTYEITVRSLETGTSFIWHNGQRKPQLLHFCSNERSGIVIERPDEKKYSRWMRSTLLCYNTVYSYEAVLNKFIFTIEWDWMNLVTLKVNKISTWNALHCYKQWNDYIFVPDVQFQLQYCTEVINEYFDTFLETKQ